MPTFKIGFEFEAYCEVCGAGMCGEVHTIDSSARRGVPIIRISPCPVCEEARADEIAFLEKRSREKSERITELENEIQTLKRDLYYAQLPI